MKRFILVIIATAITSFANAQTTSPELVSSAGDSFNNASYQLDWSIGECLTATHTAGAYVLSQGFHQNSYNITAVEDLRTDMNINVYPNPTTDFVSVNFSKVPNFGKVVCNLTNMNGKVLQQKLVLNETEEFDFSNYVAGVYFLTVKQENQLIKSFKIIKN